MTVDAAFRVLNACPWCSSEDLKTIARRLDQVPVKRCNRCHLAFAGALPEDLGVFYGPDYFSDRSTGSNTGAVTTGYEDYEGSYSPSSFRWLALTLKAIVGDRSVRLLDVGAATGTFMEMARYEGFEVTGSELNEAAVQTARERGLDVVAGPFDSQDFSPAGFQVITALEVLEHVTDLRAILIGLKSLLSADGILCFFVPNVPDHLIEGYGDSYIDFNKSLEHTLYLNPSILSTAITEVFGPGSLSLLTKEVPQDAQSVSYALGIVRNRPVAHPSEAALFELLERPGRAETLPHLAVPTLMACALTAAKFFDFDLAEQALAQSAVRGIPPGRLAPLRAQLHRNKGELLKAIEVLMPVVNTARLDDPFPTLLLIETIEELLPLIGIKETGLDRGLTELVARTEQTQRALVARDIQVDVERERADVDTRLGELTSLLSDFHRTLEKLDREHNERDARLHERELAAQLATDKANTTVVGLQTTNTRLASERARLESELAGVYRSRAWRMVTALRSFKYGFREVAAAPVRLIRALGRTAAPSDQTRPAGLLASVRSDPSRLLSVVIPVFNKGWDLLGAIDSVLESTVADVEIVVWDDGSTDPATITALEQAAQKPRVSLFHGPNRGVVAARNAAMGTTSSRFICCLDPDDRVDPTYFEKALAMLLTEPDIGIAYPWASTTGDKVEIWETQDLNPELIATVNHVPVCAVFRREAFLESGGYSNRMTNGYEDWEYWATLAELGYRGRVIPEPLFHYVHRSSISSSRDARARRVHEDLAQMIQRLHPGLQEVQTPIRASAPYSGELSLIARSFRQGVGRPIVVTLPWFTVGGADRVVGWLIQHWVEQGRTVVVIATERLGEGMQDKFVELLAVTPYVYNLDNFLPKDRWFEFVSAVLSAMNDPILFNVGSSWLYEHLAALRRALPKLRVIDQQFNDVGHFASNQKHAKSIDLTIAAYEQLASRLRTAGRLSEAVSMIHVGVETPGPIAPAAVREFRNSIAVPDDAKLVLWVGRLSKEKRPEWIVRLAELLGNAQARFLIVGDGPLAEELGPRLTGSPWIIWLPHLESMGVAYGAADVVVLTSSVEGVPLTLMEALLAGVPVVATRVGGVPDLEGLDGVALTSPTDFEEMAARVRRLVRSPARTVNTSGEFGLDEMLRSYDALLDTDIVH